MILGNYYPFFINNGGRLGDAGYLYQVSSPCLDTKCRPVVNLEKVAEITRKDDPHAKEDFSDMMSSQLMAIILKNFNHPGAISHFKSLMSKDDPEIIDLGPTKMPGIILDNEEEEDNQALIRSMIVNLRDDVRWRNYRFYAGRLIDIFWNKTSFITAELKSDGEEIWLEPKNMYALNDLHLAHPKSISNNLHGWKTEKFSGKNKISDLNRYIKRLEWRSFDRQERA